MKTQELRQKYLEFFEKKGHKVISSASLLPENDSTTLFTGSGMQPMVPYLLGETHPAGTRITDSQKCFRSGDIEEVGDNRHTTFFEMLGNWSLGDYFKEEQIPWMFEFLTKEIGLDPQHLYITSYIGNKEINIDRDQEAALLWQKQFALAGIDAKIIDNPQEGGMQDGRIFYYDDSKNWWSRAGVPAKMPIGEPGGPDTEMFWDYGVNLGLHEVSEWKDVPCHVNCDCGRFIEIGNNVFMQYIKTDKGFEVLPQKNVDFGGGLERIVAASMGQQDIFMIDVFDKMREAIEQKSNTVYLQDDETTYAYRVILDHLRAATFLIADGAPPSNKDQGYFTRRLVRRAIRFGHKIGIQGHFCGDIVKEVITSYKDTYSELLNDQDRILQEIEKEEKKFQNTIKQGIKQLKKLLKTKEVGDTLSGQEAFDLYQSFGFPVEITTELAEEMGYKVNSQEFLEKRKSHADQSRKGAEQKFKGGLADHSDMSVKYHTATHLLHAAIQQVLGKEAVQKGSNITPERLRFDFSYPEKLTDEQKQEVEQLVNDAIAHDYPISFELMSVEAAKQKGAIGLFDYGDQVKVYTVGDVHGMPNASKDAVTFSREFCGGPHVESTGKLGTFKIAKEKSTGAGVRRIKAILE